MSDKPEHQDTPVEPQSTDAAPAAEPTDTAQEPIDEVAEPAPHEAEITGLKDQLLRAHAEMENLRKRATREVEEARRYAVTGFARDMLEVSDNLARAVASIPAEVRESEGWAANLATGVDMTERTLLNAFEKHKISRVAPEKGERFDHQRHQAMFEVPTADFPPGTIAEVMAVGYVIADRLLRPAMVGVAKAPAPSAPVDHVDQEA